MILRALAILLVIAFASPAAAAEHVTVGLTRSPADGPVFLAASRGYFNAEGLDVDLRAFSSDNRVLRALASGALDFGVASYSALAFDLAGRGAIAAVAAQARERRGYEGNAVVASNAAYDHGLRQFADLANKAVAIDALGSAMHCQLGRIAQHGGFALGTVTVKPLQSPDVMARAVQSGSVDAAILPARFARDLLTASQGKFIAWYSELDEQQLGALFAGKATIARRRATVEKFVRAYRRGVADYAAALLRHDRYRKRITDAKADAAAAPIAAYVYPDAAGGVRAVEVGAYFIDPRARIDIADLARQIAWFKAQGLLDKDVDARAVVDLSFTAGP
jgi:NitT/TauT family transport system substrate-binding protein